METSFLGKIRKLNWVLSESTTGNLSFEELSDILSEIVNSNFYVIDKFGKVVSTAYTNEDDTSTFEDELGYEVIPKAHNDNFLFINETKCNLFGEEVKKILGSDYGMADKYHMIVPSFCGGQRLGTILLARYDEAFSDEEIALAEYGATVIGLEIQRNLQFEHAKEINMKMACEMALQTLSFSEHDALVKILGAFDGDETTLVASKIAAKFKLTNSVIVSALKKLESAGLLDTKSLGMKGTYIKILNPFLRDIINHAKI